ncbi:hypothetical protein DFP72DRAFT_839163 [Ephemerocybe angulata]|uniref:Uncharacterized protein n=1 Tax=Ephemerocybe angulata TaxID=980116 RepID=A0A8H6MGT6_9AGAR|nr:hypothetical protein DFP72DRAFT_839163 [Tulosesus angulatus]
MPENVAERAHRIPKRGSARSVAQRCPIPAESAALAILNARIRRLEVSERRLKQRLEQRAEDLRDSKTELEGTVTELLRAQEQMDRQEEYLKGLRTQVDKYRGWWLNEYYFVKLLLGMIPKPAEVAVIAASSHARYKAYSAEGSSTLLENDTVPRRSPESSLYVRSAQASAFSGNRYTDCCMAARSSVTHGESVLSSGPDFACNAVNIRLRASESKLKEPANSVCSLTHSLAGNTEVATADGCWKLGSTNLAHPTPT